MCVLPGGVQKLGLEEALPEALREACRRSSSVIEAVLACDELGELDGDVFLCGCERREIKGGSLRSRLKEASEASRVYVAELSHAKKTPHHLSGELCRSLSRFDVRDVQAVELPMWDRGHVFVGGEGVGSCLHVDQAPFEMKNGLPLGVVEQCGEEL